MSLKDPLLRTAYKRKWYLANRERLRPTRRAWAEANRDKRNRYCREWAARHPERKRATQARFRDKDREAYRKNALKYYYNNKEKCAESRSKWSAKNPGYFAKIARQRKLADPNFKMLATLRRRLLCALKRDTKSGSTIELLGCSIENFWIYLESKFESGMTRANHGSVWHIDHIMPCAIFDLSKPEHQRRCFHFSNLQPLFAADNIRKRAKVLTNQFQLL